MPSELANTSLATAFNIGNLSGNATWNWNSAIDGIDPNQYYRFSLSNTSSFSLALSGLQANANLDLINSSGGLIATSANLGTLSESTSRQLAAGTYYIRVSSVGGANTAYTLGLQNAGAVIDAGSTIGSAFDFGSFTTNTSRTWNESVSTSDTLDVYRINLVQYSNLSLSLKNLTANADLQLLDNVGTVLVSSSNAGTTAESIVQALNAGTYFVRVNSVSSTTNYTLSTATSFVNAAPAALQFSFNKTTFSNTETLTLTNGQVWDKNGTTDLSRVDFRLLRPDNTWSDISDAYTFTPSNTDNRSASFAYSLNLSGYASGNYTLQAIAYDKAGAASNVITKTFTVQVPNQAPNSLQFGLNKTTFTNTEALSITSGYVFDGNGASDLTRVDFRLLNANGTSVDLSDATSFTPLASNANWGSFSYSLNLSGYAAGNYTLWAIAYDKAGAISNTVTQGFTVQVPVLNDWFSLNLKDKELIDLSRNLATDGKYSRNDMMALFRNTEDGNVVDATELLDLRTLVSNASRFNMDDAVRVLANKVVNGDVANQWYTGGGTRRTLGNLYAGSASSQMENLLSKWFLGLDRPTATSYDGTTTYEYRLASGALFQNGVSYQDIKQGDVGDCYFLAGLAETALRSASTIQNMFIDNGDNTFTVRFFKNGVADYVTVDRYLPSTYWGVFAFANSGNQLNSATNELWVALAEKAYAQINESGWIGQENINAYQGINGGWDTYAFNQITGLATKPPETLNLTAMVTAAQSGKLLGLGSKQDGFVASNIVPNHNYVVTGYNAATQKFTLFNPWGVSGGYYGGSQRDGTLELSWSEITANFSAWTRTV